VLLRTASLTDSFQIRWDVLQKIKNQVRMYLGDEPQGVRRYALAYKKDIERTRWRESSLEKVFLKMQKSRFIFGGDFHAFAQAQRVHLRFLRHLFSSDNVVVAVECIESRHQKALDRFIAGEIDESTFLKKVNWARSWGFPWEHYRPLFDLVREKRGRCLALNLKTSSTLKGLKQRDLHAASLLVEASKKLSETHKIYVIFGDLHIARERLPACVRKKLKAKVPCVTLFLNPEKIYFQIYKKNLENQINVVQFNREEYCLLESPPWVKWQSYLLFLEENSDSLLGDDTADYSEHLQSLLQILSMDMGIQENIDFSVSSFRDHDFLELWLEVLTQENYSIAKKFVENDMNFFDPKSSRAYLARGTVNYAAQLVGHIFHARLCGLKQGPTSFPNDFEKRIWLDAVAFFLSKLINPHRKPPSMNDLKKRLAAFSPEDRGEIVLKLALDQKMRELLMSYNQELSVSVKTTSENSDQDDLIIYTGAAQILGSMLGEKLHRLSKAGRLSRMQLLSWLRHPVAQVHFQKFYIQVLKEIDKLELGEKHGV
jgi:hypothetical protein